MPVNGPPAAPPGPLCLCASPLLHLYACFFLHLCFSPSFSIVLLLGEHLFLSLPLFLFPDPASVCPCLSVSVSLLPYLLLCFSWTYPLLPVTFLSVASVSVPEACVYLCWPLFPPPLSLPAPLSPTPGPQ